MAIGVTDASVSVSEPVELMMGVVVVVNKCLNQVREGCTKGERERREGVEGGATEAKLLSVGVGGRLDMFVVGLSKYPE